MSENTPILPEDLFAEMKRLGSRNYPEIGVPMYLLPEDLRGGGAPGPQGSPAPELGAAFQEAAGMVAREKGAVTAEDIAQIIEVIADRTFIGRPFSDLSEPE